MQEIVDSELPLPVLNQVGAENTLRFCYNADTHFQIDLHPFMTRTDVVAFCKMHDIALEVPVVIQVCTCPN